MSLENLSPPLDIERTALARTADLLSNGNPIESATNFENSIALIPRSICVLGAQFLTQRFHDLFPDKDGVRLTPILRGGSVIGELLSQSQKKALPTLGARMSYYIGQERLSKPKCYLSPLLHDLFYTDNQGQPATRAIAATEAVIDTKGTLTEYREILMEQINRYNQHYNTSYPHPDFYVFALVSKAPLNQMDVDGWNVNVAFHLDPKIWIWGWGCDDNDRGRDALIIGGSLSPHANELPEPPYCIATFPIADTEIPNDYRGLISPAAPELLTQLNSA